MAMGLHEQGGEPTRVERFIEIVTSTEFMLPAVFVFITLAIGYSVYFWPPDPGRMSRFMPPPVSGRRLHVARVARMQGGLDYLRGNETRWQALVPGKVLGEGDQIRMGENAGLRLELPRGAVVRVRGKALLQFHGENLVLRYGSALVENPNEKVDLSMSVPSFDCWGRGVRFFLEQSLRAAPAVTAFAGTVQIRTGRRRFSLEAGQHVSCPRLGVLSPVENRSEEARQADLAPFAAF